MPPVTTRAVAFLLALIGTVLAPSAAAQDRSMNPANALSQRERPVRVTIQPAYQRFNDDDLALTQWSAPLRIAVPFLDRWQVNVRGSAASAGGGDLTRVSGLSDVEVALSYAASVGAGSMIVTTHATVPTGTQRLTRGEFDTVTLLSQDFYRVRVPSFGQGGGGGGGVTWALPVSEALVVGLGTSFRYRAGYEPMKGMQGTYNPGNETRLTGGFDVRLGRISALSIDVSYYLYGSDTLDGVERLDVGNRLVLRVQYLREWESRTLRVIARYEGQNESTIPDIGQKLQAIPSQAALQGQFETRLTEAIGLSVFGALRRYDETASFDAKTTGTIGVESTFSVSDRFALGPSVTLTGGSVTGVEGGISAHWEW